MPSVPLKPLTVNRAWKGRRFKTKEYKQYEHDLLFLLPSNFFIPDGPLTAYYTFGVSSKLSDWDNPCKPCQDVLQKKYGFDDRRIHKAIVEKVYVPKGEEYITFRFEPYEASWQEGESST